MAARKRATRRGSGRASRGPANRFLGTRKRGSASRKKGGTETFAGLRRAFSRDVVGVVLLVTGLFLTAAFLTGRGAFLGEAGLAAVTYLLGLAGFTLPALTALAGLLLLLGRLPWGRSLGAALVLLAVATTLAVFADAGGLLG